MADENIEAIVAAAIVSHEEARHSFKRGAIARMVKEHEGMVEDLGMMIDDLYGEKSPIPGDPDRRVGGRLTNGGVKIKVPVAIWVAVIGFAGLIVAALITVWIG